MPILIIGLHICEQNMTSNNRNNRSYQELFEKYKHERSVSRIVRCVERPHAVLEMKRCWTFKNCAVSGKRLWLKPCVRVVLKYDGPGTPVYDYVYFDPKEYLLCQLKY